MRESKVSPNADTELYGIFGNPVRHSLSPLIHNTLFQRLGMNAVYLAFEVPQVSLGLAFEGIRSLGIKGVNITVPFKEEAIEFIDEIPEDVDRCAEAINTVVNKNGKLLGYNTDGPGLLWALKEELGFDPEGKTVLILGAGGAARGALFSLAHARAEEMLILNRTPERAEGLREHLATFFPGTHFESVGSAQDLKKKKIDLVVNATSLGMNPALAKGSEMDRKGGVKAGSPFDLCLLNGKCAVYDMVYSPSETVFLKQAKGLGFPCTGGLGMLAAQAALSFGLWTGRNEGVRESMLEIVKAC